MRKRVETLIDGQRQAHMVGGPSIFRFSVGDKVWVRDRGVHGGYKVTEAVVREQHYHPERRPGYPHGEGYALDGELWWDCYPGCRVFKTKKEATAARIGDSHE